MRNIVLIVVILMAAGTSYFTYNFYFKPNPTTTVGNNVGNIFNDLEVPLITGETFQISDLEGDIIILDFLAPFRIKRVSNYLVECACILWLG
jgi:hypothetical protein